MLQEIRQCKKCGLCCNQQPLLDEMKTCEIFWVGLSAKKINSDEEIPLSPSTNTGMLIQMVEEMLDNVETYKTNLVKCVPLDDNLKLRYPNKREIDDCFDHLQSEIRELSPKIVFLLGEKVYSSVSRHFDIKFDKWNGFDYDYKEFEGTYYVPIHHPSYIYVYQRKNIKRYIQSIENIINTLICL